MSSSFQGLAREAKGWAGLGLPHLTSLHLIPAGLTLLPAACVAVAAAGAGAGAGPGPLPPLRSFVCRKTTFLRSLPRQAQQQEQQERQGRGGEGRASSVASLLGLPGAMCQRDALTPCRTVSYTGLRPPQSSSACCCCCGFGRGGWAFMAVDGPRNGVVMTSAVTLGFWPTQQFSLGRSS
jgi:hypothetical protein